MEMEDRVNTGKTASAPHDAAQRNAKRPLKAVSCVRTILALFMAVVMLATAVLTNWPQTSGLLDFLAKLDETITDDMIPETVEAASPTNWAVGETWTLASFPSAEAIANVTGWGWYNARYSGYAEAYNWNILRMVIESWGRPKEMSGGDICVAGTKPLTIYVNEVKDGATFDAIVRNPITIKKNQKIRIIGVTRQGVDAIRFTREANTNFGAFFRVEEGGELCLGEKLAFTGDVTRQWQGAPYTEWVTTNDETSVVDGNAAIGFGNIGVRFMVGGKGFYAKFSGGGTRLSQFQATSTSPAPNIGLYTSANSFNYELKGNGTSPAKLPLSTSSGPYYVLAFDSSVGIRPINFNDFTSEGPAVSRNMTQFKNLSFEEKRPFLWELKQAGNYYYLKNLSSGKILKSTGTTLETISTASSYSVTRPGRYEREDWALGSRDSDTFTGDAYFVKSLGTFTIDGAVFRDLVLPADGTAVKSDGSINKNLKGNNAAPIVIDGGSFFMRSGAITNNTIAYTPDESMLQSSGEHDQTDAKTKTRAEIEENAPNNSAAATGSAGALIIKNGAIAEITGGTIGALSPVTEDEKKHFARDFAGNPALNDGNKGDAGAIIVTGENTTLTMKNEHENRYPVITGNTGAHAGTISVTDGALFTLEGKTKIIGNYNYIGGAVTPVGTGRFTMNGGDIAANDTMRLGGGIMVQSDDVTLIRGEIRENTAWGAGGGIYVQGHKTPYAKTLHLKHPTNIYNNYATSSGIDIAPDRSVNVHKESTAKDRETFGLAYKETNDGYGTHQTNDRINVDRSGVGDINNNKSGSGGGVWLCPAGNTYLGNDAHLVLKVGGNLAEVQGDDFMKDNGGDGGVIFGANATTFWNTDWRTDNPVANGDGWYDTMPGARSGGAFTTVGFSASNALKLHSDATVTNVPGELNIYGNISRRGGGIGADGTLLIATNEPDVSVIQGIMTLEKKFAGSAKQDILMTVSIENEELNEKVTLGTYHLSDNPETVAANNAGITEEEVVRYETGHKVTIGIPQFIPGSEAKQHGDKYGVQLYDYNGGRWLDNRYQIVLEETDVNGNPLTDSRLQMSGLTIGKQNPVAAGPRVTYKTLTFSQDATNVQKPEIEKYINNVVHHDVIAPDEVFEFEIMAKMADDAKPETASFVVSDTLQKELVFCDVNGNPVRPGVAGDFFKTVRDIYWVEASDHVGTGTGAVTQTTGGNMNTWPLVATKTITEEADGRQTLTVGFMPNRLKDNNNLPNKWVRIRFYARFRDNASYQKALTHARGQAAGGYTDVSEGTGAGARVYWRNVTENTPLVSVPAGQETHAGIENHAHLSVDYGNDVKVEIDSNTVTVKPKEPTIEKYVNDVVHTDLPAFNDIYTYDIIAYVPEGATEITITDTLIKELELCGFGGTHVTSTSTNHNRVIFNGNNQLGKFDIRTTNDHLGNGAGTVTNRNGVSATFDATTTNGGVMGNGRLQIEEINDGGHTRQRLTLHLTSGTEGNANEVFEAIKKNNARWIHFSFKARIRPEYYTVIANKLKSGNLGENPAIGWESVGNDGTVLSGATRTSHNGTPSVIDYGAGSVHAGEANRAQMNVTVTNGSNSTSARYDSNTVTIKPAMTTLTVNKDWYNTKAAHLQMENGVVKNDAAGKAFMRAFAESLSLQVPQTGNDYGNGSKTDTELGFGTDYEIASVERKDTQTNNSADTSRWTVTWKKKGTTPAEQSPITLTIMTSDTVTTVQGATRITWTLTWSNLPHINNGNWQVTETHMEAQGFEAPVYSGTDTSGQSLTYAAQDDRIGNTHKNDDTTTIYVEKKWENIKEEELNGKLVSVVLFAKFTADGRDITLAIDKNNNNTSDWKTYGKYFTDEIRRYSATQNGDDGRGWMELRQSANPELHWKGYWTKLPMYLGGDENIPITYEIREGSFNGWSGDAVFYTGDHHDIGNFRYYNEGKDYSYKISGGQATTVIDPETGEEQIVRNYSLTNAKTTVEKYVNQAVHAELPSFEEEFTYDILAYIPDGAERAVITDTLPAALEFVDNQHRTLYTYNASTGTRSDNKNGNNSFNRNNVIYSAYGNGVGRYNLVSNNNHLGNGQTGTAAGVDYGSVDNFAASAVNYDTTTKQAAGVSIDAADKNAPQTLTIELNREGNRWVFAARDNGKHWVHLRFNVRIRPEYYDDLVTRLSYAPETWRGTDDASLGWAIVSAKDEKQYGEMVNGDGTVLEGRKESGNAYLSYGDVHAGLGNHTSLQVDNFPDIVYSNTVTVTPKTTEILIYKYWRGIETPDQIGYYNYQSTNNLLKTNVPYTGDPNSADGIAFMTALANSFMLSDDPVSQPVSYADYFEGWTMQDPVREREYVEAGGTAYTGSARLSTEGERKPWYVTWKNTQGETHPATLVIITDPVPADYLGSGSADTYRWRLVWYNLPDNGRTYHVTETQLTGFDAPVHPESAGGKGYATNGGGIRNTRLNDERLYVDVHKEWVNIKPGNASNTSVVVRLVARKADGSMIPANDTTFTQGNGGQPFNITNITLNAANGWEGGWPLLPKYYRNDSQKRAENLITYTVEEVSYTQDGQPVSTGSGYSWSVRDNATGKVINRNGTAADENITFGDATVTNYDYTLVNEKPAIEKYVNQAVHAELPAFNDIFTYDIVAYVPEGYTTVTIRDPLPAALEFVDSAGNSMYTYNTTDGSYTKNTSFNKNRVVYSPVEHEYNKINGWRTNDHTGSGEGYVKNLQAHIDAGARSGLKQPYTIGDSNMDITAADGVSAQTLTINLGRNHGKLVEDSDANHGVWIHLRFNARIRPEYYLAIINRMAKADGSYHTTTDPALGWAVVSADNSLRGEKTDGDGTVIQGRKQTAAGAYIPYGTSHEGEGNYAELIVDNQPEIYSNTVTVVPQTTDIVIDKRWVGTSAADHFFLQSGYVELAKGVPYIKALAEHFIVSSANVPDITKYGGTWTMNTPVRSGSDWNNWTVTWSRTENGQTVTAPVKLLIRTDITPRTFADGNTGIRWTFTWSGLPLLENPATGDILPWSVAENGAFSYLDTAGNNRISYDTPVYRDTEDNLLAGATTAGGSVTNIRIHDDTTRVAVNKQWRNIALSGRNQDTSDPTTYVEVGLVASYTTTDGTMVTITDIASDAFFASKNVKGTLKLIPEGDWEDAFENLPRYYRGHLTQEISYRVVEKRAVDSGAEITGFTSRVTDNAAGDGYTIVNEKEVIEKYVNSAVHAEIPRFDDVFEYDLMVYVPEDATSLTITDTLPAALEYVDRENRTLYTYGGTDHIGNAIRTQNNDFNTGNSLIRSVRGENPASGSVDLWSVFDHDGSGNGHVGNVTQHEVDAGAMKGTMALRAGAVQVTAADGNAAQTMTITLNRTEDEAFFNFVNRYDTRWVQIHFAARIRPEFYARMVTRITQDHETFIDASDPALGWAIVDNDGTVTNNHMERVDGDGTVTNVHMQTASGAYTPLANIHAGEGNYASLAVNNNARAVYSNTVTVLPFTEVLTVDKLWAETGNVQRPSKKAWKDSLVLHSKLTVNGNDQDYTLEARTMQEGTAPDTWTGEVALPGNTNVTVTLTIRESATNPNRWEAVWSGLPRLNDTHYYTVTENALEGYVTAYDNSDTSLTGFTLGEEAASNGDIVNTQKEVEIPVTKLWRDTTPSSRPDSIRLIVTGTATYGNNNQYTHTVTKEAVIGPTPDIDNTDPNNPVYTYTWPTSVSVATITGLPMYFYDAGEKTWHHYTYTVREAAVSGYLPTDEYGNVLTGTSLDIPVTGAAGDTSRPVTLYNTEETRLRIIKNWRDADNATGRRPSSIEVIVRGTNPNTNVLVYNGTETATVLTESETLGWTYTLTGLPKYCDDNKTPVKYTVEEVLTSLPSYYRIVGGATANAEDDTANPGAYKAELTNEELTDLTISKTWHAATQADQVAFQVYGTTVKPTGFPGDPSEITRYEIKGDSLTGYSVRQGNTMYEVELTAPATAADTWSKTISALPKYAPDTGLAINYYVKEYSVKKGTDDVKFDDDGKATADGVTWVMSPNTYSNGQNTVNGAVSFTNTAETTLKLTKTWAKADPSDQTAFPEVLSFKVTGTVAGEGGSTRTVFPETTYKAYVMRSTNAPAGVTVGTDILATEKTNASGGAEWTGITIPGLKTHHTDGQRITYTVTEVVPDGYRATPESAGVIPANGADSVAITNTKVATTRVRVEKIWSPLPTNSTLRDVKVQLVATVDDTHAGTSVTVENESQAASYTGLHNAVDNTGGWVRTITYDPGNPVMEAEWDDLPRSVVKTGDSTNTYLNIAYSVKEIDIPQALTDAGYKVTMREETSTTGDNAKTVTLINAKPAIEKYVNSHRPVNAPARENPTNSVTHEIIYSGDDGGVHTDLNAFNETFTYDVQAYVTHDADRVVITDTLNEAIMLVDAADAPASAGTLTTEIHVAAKDGNTDGSAPALSSRTGYVAEGGFGLPSGAITKTMTVNTSVPGKEFQMLRVEIDLTSAAFASDAERDALRGKWIQITFNARIKPSYLTPEALVGVQGDVLSGVDGYDTVLKADDEPIEDAKMNRLDVSAQPYTMTHRRVYYGTDPNVEQNHRGAINQAQYEIWFDNAATAAYDKPSNKVTVDPPVTSVTVTKEWQGAVPQSVNATYIETFLKQFVLHRSDNNADAYLWGSTDYNESDSAQIYKWKDVALKSGSSSAYIVVLEEKTAGTGTLDPTKLRSVVVETDADNDGTTDDVWTIIFSGLPLITGLDYYVTEKDNAFTGYQNAYYDNSASAVTGAVEDGAYHEGRVVNTQETDITVTKVWQDSNGNTVTAPTDVKSVTAALTATYTYGDTSTTPTTTHTVVITKDTVTDNGTVVATPTAAQTALQALLEEKTFGSPESWKAKWEHLPSRIDTGTSYAEIKYSVAETKVTMTNGTESAVDSNRVVVGITNPSFYEVIYDSANTAGLSGASAATTITNRETWESVSVKAIKSWDPSAPSGAQITLELVASYQNGTDTETLITNPGAGQTQDPVFTHAGISIDTTPHTLDGNVGSPTGDHEDPAWTTTWSGLPKYIIVGNRSVPIDYTVRETTTTENYITAVGTPVVDASGNAEINVTNTQDKTTLSLTKAWQDAAGNAAAPSLAAGASDEAVAAYVRAFAENLMLFDTTAPETDLLAARSTTPVITPPAAPANTTWTVTWGDVTDTITLKIDTGAPATGTSETYWSAASWSLTFEGLPYNNGATYGVKEKAPLTGYMTGTYKDSADADTSYAPANGKITNRQQDATRISASVTKDWSDESNLDGSRLPSVTFHLYATTQPGDATSFRLVQVKNTASGMPEVTTYTEEDYKNNTLRTSAKDDFDIVLKTTDAVTGNDNRWTMNVGNLPQYDLSVAGTQSVYTYRLREVTDLTDTGYAVTNATATPADIAATTGSATTPIAFTAVENKHTPEKTEIPVTKIWEDGLGAARDADTEITLTLTATRDEDGAVIDIPNVTGPVTLKKNSSGVTAGAGDTTWSYTFTDLPKTFEGKAVTYSVTETGVPAHYTYELTTPAAKQTDGSYNTVQIKNTLEINVSVKKAWDDDSYSGRPSDEELKAALTLYVLDETNSANPVETAVDAALIPSGQPLVSGTGNDRTITWNGLPYPGANCTYIVKEDADAFTSLGYFAPIYPGTPSQGYAKTHTDAAQAETITNRRYDTGTVGLSLTKNWSDISNQDGIRPTEATFILVAGLDPAGADSEFYMVDVTNPQDPSIAWDYRLGSGDTLFDYYDNMSDTNKRKYHITIKKDDADTANNAASWTYAAIDNLPKYAFVNGTQYAYTYRLIEVDVATGYTPTQQPAPVTIDGSTAATITFTATNTHTPGTTEITVNKSWVGDENNSQGTRKQITIKLEGYVDGAPLSGSEQTVTLPEGGTADLSDSADWSVIFTGLPQYHEGKKIIWRVEEVDDPSTWTPAYTVSGSPAEIDGTTATTHNVAITNTIVRPDPTDIVFTKTWADTDIGGLDYSAGRPQSLVLKLQQSVDGVNWTDVDGNPQPVESTDTNGNPVYTWEDLPKATLGRAAITYRVTETVPQGYTATNTASGAAESHVDLQASNGFAAGLTNTLDTTRLTLQKNWDDGNSADRPDAITVTVTGTYNNGLSIPNATYVYQIGPGLPATSTTNPRTLPVTVDTSGNWSAVTIDHLPKYYLGNPITWKVTEQQITGYDISYTPTNGSALATDTAPTVTVTNSMAKAQIGFTKTWVHGENTATPDSLPLTLTRTGDATFTKTITIGSSNTNTTTDLGEGITAQTDATGWGVTVTGLPKYQGSSGDAWEYVITEDTVKNYTAPARSVVLKEENGYTGGITNTYKAPEYVGIRMIKNWEISDDLLANGALSTGVVLTARIADTTGSEPSYNTKADVDAADQDRKLTVFRTDSAKNGYDKTNKDHILATPDGDNWKFTITDLPKTDKQNREITYIIADLSKYNGSASTLDSRAIIRVMDPAGTSARANETVSIEGTQKWTASMTGVSAQEAAGYAEKITVKVSAWKDSATKEFEKTYTVLAPGVAPASASEIASTASGDDWKFKITGLYKYTEAGDPLSYAVEETIVRKSATAGTFRLSAFTLKEGTDAITYEASYEYQVPLTLLSASVAGGTSSGTEWNAAASGTSFKARFAAPHAALSGVKLNGTGLTSGTDYTAESGSTIITLLRESSTVQQELQKALDENGGSCVLTAVFTTTTGEREAEAKFTVIDTDPALSKTGTSNALSSGTENTENATGAATGSTESSTENNTGNNTENNTGNGTESNTGSSTENNAGNSTESNTGSSTENNTGSSTESNTGSSTESNTGNSIGGSTENNAGGGTENNTVTPGTTNGTNTGTEGNGTEQNSGTETGAGVLGRVKDDTVTIKGTKTWKDNQNKNNTRPDSIELEIVGVREDNGQIVTDASFTYVVHKPGSTVSSSVPDAASNIQMVAEGSEEENESFRTENPGNDDTWTFYIDYYVDRNNQKVYLPRTTSDGVRVIYTVSEKTLSDNRYKKTDETLRFDEMVENFTFGIDYTYAVTDEYVPQEASGAFTATMNKSVAKVTIPEEIRYRITGTANGKTVYDEYYYIYTTEYPGPNMVTDNTTNGNRKPDIDIKVNSLTNEGKDWGFLIKDLPKFDPADDASPITYDVEEIPINGQSSQIVKKPLLRDLAAGSDTYELSQNSVDRVVSNLTEVTLFGTKTWDHGSNTAYPDTITLQVTGYNAAGAEVTKATVLDGTGPGTKVVTVGGTYTVVRGGASSAGVTVTSMRNTAWSFRIDNLPMYEDEAAQSGPIRYVVKEIDDPKDKYSITNETAANAVHTAGLSSGTYAVTNTYERPLNIEVTKTWEGDSASDRPAEVVFTLYANGTKVTDGGKDKTVTLTAAGGWKGSFTNLPATDASGNAITYSVKEEELPNGYEYVSDAATTDNVKTVSGSSVTFKNTKTSPVEVSVEKHWFDAGGKSVNPPDEITSVTVQLTSNGVVSGSAVTLNSANSWKHTWENLPLADAEGNAISYSVTETQVLDKDGKNRINEYKQELTGTKVGTTHKHILNNTAKPPEEEKVKKTVNGTSDYTMKGTADALVYSIKSTVPDNATKFVMSDKMPGVMTTTAAQAFVAGTEQKTDMIIAIEDSLVTLTIENAEAYRGKEIELRITAKIKEGADLTPYSNRQIPNTASVSVNGEAYATSEPATVTPEVLSRSRSINSNGTSNGRSGRNARTGDNDLMTRQLMMVGVIGAGLTLATAGGVMRHRRKKREDDELI